MEYDKIITELVSQNKELEGRIAFLEFRLELLFENSNISNLLFESKITREQYSEIMALMDDLRNKLDNQQKVNHVEYESKISEITGNHDYHFAESVAKAFMEDRRWEEVFPALYGDFHKYENYLENVDHKQ